MRLATRLTIAFAAVAVVPIGAVALVAQRLVEDRYRGEFARSLDGAEKAVWREYEQVGKEVQEAVKRVARADDPMVGQLLLDLAKGGLEEERQRGLAHRAPGEMRALGLDVFELVDDHGVVLAAGHYPGRAGQRDDEALARSRRHRGKPVLVVERVVTGGSQRQALAVEVAERVETDYARVTVVAGRELSSGFLERLRVPARLIDGEGKALAQTWGPHQRMGGGAMDGFPSKGWPRRTIVLPGAEPAAKVEVAVPDDDLRRALYGIRLAAGVVSLGGLALALILGAVVARRITRPLGTLAEGARRVAAGDLEAAVEVGTRDEVGDLAGAFNAMIQDLGEAREQLVRAERVAAWREIARRIAHEIKNPLTPIQMAVETLQRVKANKPELFDEIFRESAGTILEEVARLKKIVTEFSSFARMPEPRLAEVDARELVEGALGLYAGAEPPIARELGEGLARVSADREQLQQVLLNLIENARDAVKEGKGTIAVRLRCATARVEIEVADTGPGISEEVRARLFTPYYTTKPNGTGLGLAIVHRIVTDHGGEIRVSGAVGEGATFVVSLPATGGG